MEIEKQQELKNHSGIDKLLEAMDIILQDADRSLEEHCVKAGIDTFYKIKQ